MKIGCPKEIKAQEGRVGLTPAGVDAPYHKFWILDGIL